MRFPLVSSRDQVSFLTEVELQLAQETGFRERDTHEPLPKAAAAAASEGFGFQASNRMAPFSEPSRSSLFVGSTARLVRVPRKFSELSLVRLAGLAEMSIME